MHHPKRRRTPRLANVKTLPCTTSPCPIFSISHLLTYSIPVDYPFLSLFTLHAIRHPPSAASNQQRPFSVPTVHLILYEDPQKAQVEQRPCSRKNLIIPLSRSPLFRLVRLLSPCLRLSPLPLSSSWFLNALPRRRADLRSESSPLFLVYAQCLCSDLAHLSQQRGVSSLVSLIEIYLVIPPPCPLSDSDLADLTRASTGTFALTINSVQHHDCFERAKRVLGI